MGLAGCFTRILTFAATLDGILLSTQPRLDAVREEIGIQLAVCEALASANPFSQEDVDLAKFAVCALIDEVLASSAWDHKQEWLSDQLQRRHFNTADAGEEFFLRLAGLGRDQLGVREVFYLCLCLGFKGKYCNAGSDVDLDRLKREQLVLLGRGGNSQGARLFPEAYQSGTATGLGAEKSAGRLRLVTAGCLFAPLLILAILFLVYRLSLSTLTDHVLKNVGS